MGVSFEKLPVLVGLCMKKHGRRNPPGSCLSAGKSSKASFGAGPLSMKRFSVCCDELSQPEKIASATVGMSRTPWPVVVQLWNPKWIWNRRHVLLFFSRMRSEGSRFIWGCGGEAVFAESCVCVRNRSQPFATVRNRLRECDKLSTVASASGVVLKARGVEPWSSQLYWCLQRRCLCERSVWPQLYWYLRRRCLCE